MEFLNRLQTEMEPTQTEYIQAVEQLQRAWTPRYKRANDEFKRFARRIDHSDAMAQEYFLVQQNLTVLISSPKDRRRAEVVDATEREVYLDWRDQAFKTLGQAKMIMLDLHDMNIIITKQSLSAHFAALYGGVPNDTAGDHDAPRGAGPIPGRVREDPADLRSSAGQVTGAPGLYVSSAP